MIRFHHDPPLIFKRRQRGPTPAQVVALSFAVAIALATLLLWLPVSQAPGQRLTLLEALFTATSAICVTGLAVVDTGTAFSPFGQVVIMLLIQMGGLGFITLGTVLALATGRRAGLGERMRLQAQLSTLQLGGVVRLIRHILVKLYINPGADFDLQLSDKIVLIDRPLQSALLDVLLLPDVILIPVRALHQPR